MNKKNLVSLKDRSKEERKTIARMGAIKTNEIKKKKKELRAILHEILTSPVNDEEQIKKLEVAGVGNTRGALMLIEAVETAGKNPMMLKNIMELTGYSLGQFGAMQNGEKATVKIYLPDNNRNEGTT